MDVVKDKTILVGSQPTEAWESAIGTIVVIARTHYPFGLLGR